MLQSRIKNSNHNDARKFNLGGSLCMKGNIYENKGRYIVRFGRDITKSFKTLQEAERFLTGLRFENDKGTFDKRDYAAGNPMCFEAQAEKWVEYKKKEVKESSFANINRFINHAISVWGAENVKTIGYAEIEDLINGYKAGQKTKSNLRSVLHGFFTWLKRRRVIDSIPDFPDVKFELAWRNIVSPETQANILDEIYRISWDKNPKVYIGIKFLSTYISIRPGELNLIKEKDIMLDQGLMAVLDTKDKRPKIIPLLDDDIETLKMFPRAFPELRFFRHADGKPFGEKHFYKWWIRACENLGIKNVDLYGGTRHSTTVALKKFMTPEQIRRGTMHTTNKAFERYIQNDLYDSKMVYESARANVQHLNNLPKTKTVEYKRK